MRAFITGATGFIGRYVCERLSLDGITVVGLCRKKENTIAVDADEVVVGDISLDSFPDKIITEVDHCDVIVHLAASIVVPDCADTIPINVYGTKNVLTLAKKWEVKKFIFLSSIPVIGIPIDIPVTEKHVAIPRTLYHMSKYIGEKMIEYGDLSGVSTILRISSPIGPGMKSDSFLSTILRKLIKNADVEVYGNGERVQNYIDVRDIAKLIGRCVEIPNTGLYVIGGRKSYSNKEVVDICRAATGSSSKILYGTHEDKEEMYKWIISSQKAMCELEYEPEFEFPNSIEWILGSM